MDYEPLFRKIKDLEEHRLEELAEVDEEEELDEEEFDEWADE